MNALLATAAAIGALMPLTVQAQTEITLWGFYKTGVASTRYGDGDGASGNGSHTALVDGASRFVIRGREALGGGTSAIFQIDNRFRGDEGVQSVATGNTFVGLAGPLGSLRLGRLDTYYQHGIDRFRYLATPSQATNISLLSYVGNNSNPIARASRSLNMLRYDSPAHARVKAGLNWSPSAAGPEGSPGAAQKGRAWSADLTYASAPLAVGAAIWDERSEGYAQAPAGSPTGQRAWRVHGNWDFGMLSAGLAYDDSRVRAAGGDTGRKAWSVPVLARVGPGTLIFTYTRAEDTRTGGVTHGQTGARMLSLGYHHPLSKRTSLGFAWSVIDNEAGASYGYFSRNFGNLPAPRPGQDQQQLYAGLKHSF